MSNPAFIVDGYTELKIVQFLCPGQPVKRTDCNGKDVKIPIIAKRIATHIRILSNRHYPIIVLVDKENREISNEEMASQIRQCLKSEGIENQDIRIGVADRMIENWIIADWESLTDNNKLKPSTTDGCNGAALIKKVKSSYDKTTDGVELFKMTRQSVLYTKSASYKYFIDQLSGIECPYLTFEK